MSMPLPDRILQAIARADSRDPADADAIAKSLFDVSRKDFDAAVMELERQRRICICLISRGGLTHLVLWPTGVIAPHAGWTSADHASLYVATEPRRFPTAPKNFKEKSMHTTPRRPSEDKLAAIRKAIAGRGEADAIKLVDIGKSMGLEPSIASPTLNSALKYLVKAGEAESVKKKTEHGQFATHVFDPKVEAKEPVQTPARDVATEKTVPADQLQETRFGLWDDGTLTIMSGDDVFQLNTDQVKRLALLLGVSADAARTHIN